MVVTSGWGKWGDGQRVQTSRYTLNKFWGVDVYHGEYS